MFNLQCIAKKKYVEITPYVPVDKSDTNKFVLVYCVTYQLQKTCFEVNEIVKMKELFCLN